MRDTLSHWLRLLWDRAPPLVEHGDGPFIAAGAIHLLACRDWCEQRAAAAHATAHLVYSPTRFDGRGLAPIARVLLALLEDARVEALAGRELPGLARLWRPLHRATPQEGNGFEALMRRLARALADPAYDDPHPWVNKGRRLFYLDDAQQVLALCTPADLRQAATRLGHDIGQMRLPFNAKGYRPVPAYRDDHRWMWAADVPEETEPPPAAVDRGADDLHDEPPDEATKIARHPEWDGLIARLRPDWCRVVESPAPQAAPAETPATIQPLSRRLRGPLRALSRQPAARRRSHTGEAFGIDALVDLGITRRLRLPADLRVYRSTPHRAARVCVWLLVDQSASTAAVHGGGDITVLQAAAQAAAATAIALQAMGVRCAIAGFSSNGRHAVRLNVVKPLDTPIDPRVLLRLFALRSGGSTRLGAALRHATSRLCAERGAARWVLLLSDGQPHDVDVHHPRYLVADARHAVRDAARRSVHIACLALGAQPDPAALRIFGRRGTQALSSVNALPHAVQRLLT
jgi:nitric oxide reductase NorD protein